MGAEMMRKTGGGGYGEQTHKLNLRSCFLLHKPWHFSRLIGDIQIPLGRHYEINLCVPAAGTKKLHVLIQKNEMCLDGAQQEGL